jgi:hypothetical protein
LIVLGLLWFRWIFAAGGGWGRAGCAASATREASQIRSLANPGVALAFDLVLLTVDVSGIAAILTRRRKVAVSCRAVLVTIDLLDLVESVLVPN